MQLKDNYSNKISLKRKDQLKSKEDVLRLYEDLREVIEHMHKQAKKGFKYLYGKENASGDEKNFQLYYNEKNI